MVYLNGEKVEEREIKPEKHMFIGMFRNPIPPYATGGYVSICRYIVVVQLRQRYRKNKGIKKCVIIFLLKRQNMDCF